MAFSILEQLEQAKGLLSVKEVAEIFNFSQKKIYGMAHRKKLPSIKFEGNIRFDPKSLGYWLRKNDPTLAVAARAEQHE